MIAFRPNGLQHVVDHSPANTLGSGACHHVPRPKRILERRLLRVGPADHKILATQLRTGSEKLLLSVSTLNALLVMNEASRKLRWTSVRGHRRIDRLKRMNDRVHAKRLAAVAGPLTGKHIGIWLRPSRCDRRRVAEQTAYVGDVTGTAADSCGYQHVYQVPALSLVLVECEASQVTLPRARGGSGFLRGSGSINLALLACRNGAWSISLVGHRGGHRPSSP